MLCVNMCSIPVRGWPKMQVLDEGLVEEELARLKDWRRDARFIVRRYDFPSFADAVRFVNDVAAAAERRRHHPFIAIDYKHVTLRMTSWRAGGLTALDFEQAAAFDQIYRAAQTV